MDPTCPPPERAPSDLPASAGEPPRSEALEAELAALEAILPPESPAVAPAPGVASGAGGDQTVATPPPPGPGMPR
jgi:hypothetical protein